MFGIQIRRLPPMALDLKGNASHASVNFVGFQMGKPQSHRGFSLLAKWVVG